MGCILLDFLTSGKEFFSILQAWYRLFAPEKWSLPFAVSAGGAGVEIILLFVGLVMGIFSFFFLKRKETFGIFFLPMAALIAAQGFGVLLKELDGTLLIYLFAVILCSVGFGNIYETRISDEKEEPLQNIPNIQDLDKEEIREEVKEAPVEETETVIQYIENPLPLPKKHVPKMLDYDIEVPDDDDYDI